MTEPMPVLRGRQGFDQHVESIVDHAISIGANEWIDKVRDAIETTNDAAAKDLIQTMGYLIYFRVIDKLKALEELDSE